MNRRRRRIAKRRRRVRRERERWEHEGLHYREFLFDFDMIDDGGDFEDDHYGLFFMTFGEPAP